MTADPDLSQYLARVAGADADDSARHMARVLILEYGTILEYAVSEALAVRLAVDATAASILVFDVFSRLPIGVRLDMLTSLMAEEELVDDWPFLLPVLKQVFDLRNRFAHGFAERLPGGSIRVTSYNRGKESVTEYMPASLGWLVWQAQVVRNELHQLWTPLLPEDDAWFVSWDDSRDE